MVEIIFKNIFKWSKQTLRIFSNGQNIFLLSSNSVLVDFNPMWKALKRTDLLSQGNHQSEVNMF